MRRTAAVILGTAALLGVLATPASAAPAPGGGLVGTTAESLVATVKNAVTGVEVTVDNVIATL
ncbi:hypothetical protein [Streptomyces lasiicapitis]|uniref:DUF320 domain-containing protein n=1 Tax=Streptomyces lasiicapitis TaxID=1923961 RepID=A0ABQ2LIU9_9ACTN|nr:hypothetical protein [Streptomyces lasiicapitis]GGO35853.1 hypothetical protein GCM10012286_07020 [Streptomyces lasiicapitis]